MLLYAGIMFLAAAILMLFGIAIYRGRTDLIHAYHQRRVSDRAAYGRAFGKALSAAAMAPLLSGICALSGASDRMAVVAVAILITGMGIGTGLIAAVQRKYNGGVF